MAHAVVSDVLARLNAILLSESRGGVKLGADVRKEVEKLQKNLQDIRASLDDAEQKQFKEAAVRYWLDELKYACYDAEDVLAKWSIAREEVDDEDTLRPPPRGGKVSSRFLALSGKVSSLFPAPCVGFKQVVRRHDIAVEIKYINKEIDDIAMKRHMFNFSAGTYVIDEMPERFRTTSLIVSSVVYGRDSEYNFLLSKLLERGSEEQSLHIIALLGMGGVGKTTLARLAYNSHEVKNNFEIRIWVHVSHFFDELRIAKSIIVGLGCPNPESLDLQTVLQTIREFIIGKSFLLVLDDVWNEDYSKWEPFYDCLKNGLYGSKILITTRAEKVARMMHSAVIVSISLLREEDCWMLFKHYAFWGRSSKEVEELEYMRVKIVNMCGGLPLAAKTMGSLLRGKRTRQEWESIVDINLVEFEGKVLSTLMLSYNHLPPMVKQCFSFCAVFPKDYNIEKDELIKLWMAQGYLRAHRNMEMEEIGEEYFNDLATRSFFLDFEEDDGDDVRRFKMHDLVHDLAQYLSRKECSVVEVNDREDSFTNTNGERVMHSMLMLGEGASFPDYICNFKRLRTLLIRCERFDYSLLTKVLAKLFGELTSLRALDMKCGWMCKNLINEIPAALGKLIHLQHLNLSGHEIEILPESLCELYNLQILDVSWCAKLKELPQGIGKLINLRYLLNDFTFSLRVMPPGISKLTNLRKLKKFVAGGDVDGGKGCTLESLKTLNLLQECIINRLGNVTDVGEARRSVLMEKSNLSVLELGFGKDVEGGRMNEEDEELLEALQPPPNLEELGIYCYGGNTVFPNWMLSLDKLRVLRLSDCINCVRLPPLGKLLSLEKLEIFGMRSVKIVGNEFLGTKSGQGSSSFVKAFPKLKSLEMRYMDEFEEWDFGIPRSGKADTIIMPCLSFLIIHECPKLKTLPNNILQTAKLQKLEIQDCPTLKERYRKEEGEDWPAISHIPNIQIN